MFKKRFKRGDGVYCDSFKKVGVILHFVAYRWLPVGDNNHYDVGDNNHYEQLYFVRWSDGTEHQAVDTSLRLLG